MLHASSQHEVSSLCFLDAETFQIKATNYFLFLSHIYILQFCWKIRF